MHHLKFIACFQSFPVAIENFRAAPDHIPDLGNPNPYRRSCSSGVNLSEFCSRRQPQRDSSLQFKIVLSIGLNQIDPERAMTHLSAPSEQRFSGSILQAGQDGVLPMSIRFEPGRDLLKHAGR